MREGERGVISIAEAAKVLKVDAQTLRLLLQNQMVTFGVAYKKPGSTRFSYLIYAEPFYQLTGYRGAGNE